MEDEKSKRVYCTNIQESDPIIEKLMKEYLQESEQQGKEINSNDLIVNFDISYGDGETENYICGTESKIFDANPSKAQEKCTKKDGHIEEINYDEYEMLKEEIPLSKQSKCHECEANKWLNSEEEWVEYNKKGQCIVEESKQVKGEIAVYSTLASTDGTRIKGVKVNLYKLNGICPELVESYETDCDGKVVFDNLIEGSYRVIELIDKRYFEKPSYISWNEVTIDKYNTKSVIYAINKIRNKSCYIKRN